MSVLKHNKHKTKACMKYNPRLHTLSLSPAPVSTVTDVSGGVMKAPFILDQLIVKLMDGPAVHRAELQPITALSSL